MITAASFLYVAYLFSDDAILPGEFDDLTGESWQSLDHFHKLFLRAGNYFAEYDYRADYDYDASGLGRLHRKGAPSAICLSTPGTDKPRYQINTEKTVPFAIVPEVADGDNWLSGADREAVHTVERHSASGKNAQAEITCRWLAKQEVKSAYLLNEDGLKITLSGQGKIGLMLPAFQFDGKEKSVIENSGKTLSIRYRNWICRYSLEQGSVIRDTGKLGCNRNGHYAIFRAEGKDNMTVRISIFPAEPAK
jgi:hypothetical protein